MQFANDEGYTSGIRGIGGRKLAVTVLLLRDTDDGIEVYVQERVSSMPTFPNATVFPGGGVDPRDFDIDGEADRHPLITGASLSRWARALGADRARAQALLFAAARELFEETGTLLAAQRDGHAIMDAASYHAQRLALESHRLSLTQVLERNDLQLRSELMRPFARWITPEGEKVRYDVYSFVAIAPPGQEPDGNTREAASSGWFSPGLLLEGWRAGLLRLVLPTWAQLHKLQQFDTVSEALHELKRADMTPQIGMDKNNPFFAKFHNFVPPVRF